MAVLTDAQFHLINDGDLHEPEWNKAMGCWDRVVNINPRHKEARLKMLDYLYEASDSGNSYLWVEVEKRISELFEVMEETQMEPDPYVLTARGRASLELTRMGQKTDREEGINQAISDLEKVIELTPGDAKVYNYLAQAEVLKGDIESSKGTIDAMVSAFATALEVLSRGAQAAEDKVTAEVNLLDMKIAATKGDRGQIEELEEDYEQLTVSYSSEAKAWAGLARYYQISMNADKAIEAISKAIELNPDSVVYLVSASNLYYRKSSIEKDKEALSKAIEFAQNGLNLPEAQDTPGPRAIAHRNNRNALLSLLATYYIEQAIEASESGDEAGRETNIKNAKKTIEDINQLTGNVENVYTLKWEGLLSLAEGNRTKAIQKMYAAYEQFKATGNVDPLLSYYLSKTFEGRAEYGIRREFLESAIFLTKGNSVAGLKPESVLEYSEVLLQMRRGWSTAIGMADLYESTYSATDRSRSIRIKGYIGAGQLDEAGEKLSEMEPDKPLTKSLKLLLAETKIQRIIQSQVRQKLNLEDATDAEAENYEQSELEKYRKEQAELVAQLLEEAPEMVSLSSVIGVGRNYVSEGEVESAKVTITKFLDHQADNISAKVYMLTLSEVDPENVSADRYNELTEQVLAEITDELRRLISTGEYYTSRTLTKAELSSLAEQAEDEKTLTELQEKALGQFREKAFEAYKQAYEMSPDDGQVISNLFNAALQRQDMVLAEELVEKARSLNIDDCGGNFSAARLAIVREDYEGALALLDNCLSLRPIFPLACMLKSQVEMSLGRLDEAIEDAVKASSMNPMDGAIAKHKASVLYSRNLRLRRNASADQIKEVENALLEAMILNPSEWYLRSIYAELISKSEPTKALAIRQDLEEKYPNMVNSLMLGNMAMRLAAGEQEPSRKEFLYEVAGKALDNAYKMSPNNKDVLTSYSEYLRVTGQQEKAQSMFSNQSEVMWQLYLRDGQYEKATEILNKLYETNPKDVTAVRGLLVTAEKLGDKEGVQKYSQELLSIENTIENELLQIQMFLEVGLGEEARLKLASFRERNPDETRGVLLEAWSAMMNGQLEKSLSLINQHLELYPDNATAWRLRGQVHRLSGDLEQAAKDLQKSRNISSSAIIRMDLAKVYRQAGRITEAIGELKSALEDDVAPVRVRRMLEELYLEDNRQNELREFYRATLEKYPEDAYWCYRAGRFLLDDEKYDEAERLLEKSWQLSQDSGGDAAALDYYLESFYRAGKYQELLNTASKYIDTKFAPVVYAQMAQTHFKMGSLPKAVEYYRKSLEKSGTSENLMLSVLENMSRTVGAAEVIKWCQEKLSSDPESLAANMMMFNLYQRTQEYNKSLGHIDKCIAGVSSNTASWSNFMVKKANALIMAYVKTADKKYLQESISVFEAILAQQPDNMSALNNLAYLLADNNKQLDKAVEYASRSYKARPNDANRADTYGYTLCKTGEYAPAEELLPRAIQLHELGSNAVPWDVYKHLGMAQEGLGRKADAAGSYQRALEAGGSRISEKDRDELQKAIEGVLR
jgi:tetratricopeptide (TPR) repeat protein